MVAVNEYQRRVVRNQSLIGSSGQSGGSPLWGKHGGLPGTTGDPTTPVLSPKSQVEGQETALTNIGVSEYGGAVKEAVLA